MPGHRGAPRERGGVRQSSPESRGERQRRRDRFWHTPPRVYCYEALTGPFLFPDYRLFLLATIPVLRGSAPWAFCGCASSSRFVLRAASPIPRAHCLNPHRTSRVYRFGEPLPVFRRRRYVLQHSQILSVRCVDLGCAANVAHGSSAGDIPCPPQCWCTRSAGIIAKLQVV